MAKSGRKKYLYVVSLDQVNSALMQKFEGKILSDTGFDPGTHMKAVLAQQSIRELERTQRRPEEIMDAATWAVYQEGYEEGFGADADHLKTTADIDLMVAAGFAMFTIDPGEHVVNEIAFISVKSKKRCISYPVRQEFV